MAAPGVFGTQGWTTHSGYLFGPLVVVVAVIAMAEVARAPRHLTITLGAWVVIAPWLRSGAEPAALANNAITDLALIALSLPRGAGRDQSRLYRRR